MTDGRQGRDKFPEKFVRIWKSVRIYIYNKIIHGKRPY